MMECFQIVWFGKYKGKSVWHCPEEYLRWLVKQTPRSTRFKLLQKAAQDPLNCADDDRLYDEFRWDTDY